MKDTAAIQGYRLSSQQERVWLLEQAEGSPTCRVRCDVLIQGPLDRHRLEAALADVVARHEILRTSFSIFPGMSNPLQVIGQPERVKLEVSNRVAENGRMRPDSGQQSCPEGELQKRIFSLIESSPTENHLLIDLPGLCGDRTTVGLLVEEISHCYYAGQNPSHEEPMQYADYAEWQFEILQSADEETLRFQQKFHDYSGTPPVQLLWRNSNAPEPLFEPKWLGTPQAQQVWTAVQELAERFGSSVEHVWMACWEVFLSRIEGREAEMLLGCVCDARTYEPLQRAIGNMTVTVPYRCVVRQEMEFEQVLRQAENARSAIEESLEYFSWDCVTATPRYKGQPFAPVLFEFHNVNASNAGTELTFNPGRVDVCGEPFDFKLVVVHSNAAELEFHYNARRLTPEYVQLLLDSFCVLTESIARRPGDRIGALPILSSEESDRILRHFNAQASGPAQVLPAETCIHHLFELQAQITPDHVAAVDEALRLTYRELNKRANQLSHLLISAATRTEEGIGILLGRSVHFLVGMLAVLKAGAAYVPLDTAWPPDRLKKILQDAGIKTVITSKQQVIPSLDMDVQVLCLDGPEIEPFSGSTENPVVAVAPANLAYIIYTSGSTGSPKGVAVEHGQLYSYLRGILGRLGPLPALNFATVSTFTADLGNTVIFSALCTGGVLHIIAEDAITDSQKLAAYCRREHIDCLKIVPSHLNALLPGRDGADLLPKHCLILGGEPLTWDLVNRFRNAEPSCTLLNHYGPTETTVGVLTCKVEELAGDICGSTVPLGRPLHGSAIYILDQELQPVPVGTAGELCIAGSNVSRGYLNLPDITAEKFIPDPFALEPGGRLYRTGDQARYWPGGQVEFLGRVDRQVKIRGFRVELGEIEANLRQHPAIWNAAVTAREDVPGDKRLVAYVVYKDGSNPRSDEVRQWLRARLPEAMLPSAIVALEKLPITSNGKLDWRALPAPESTRPELSVAFTMPRTPEEQIMVQVWAEVLGVEKVGIDDNFFALGGDSIRSIRVRSLLQQKGLNFALPQLFQNPTVRQLVSSLSSADPDVLDLLQVEPFSMISAQDREKLPQEVEDAYPLASLQLGMLFHDQYSPERAMYLDITSFHLRCHWNEGCMRRALQWMSSRHAVLRTAFDLTSFREPLQIVYRTAPVSIQIEDLRHLSASEQESVIVAALQTEREQKFDWRQPPLVRLKVHLRSDDSFQFTFSRHHAVLDGWSFAVAVTELFETYLALLRNPAEGPQPASGLSYRNFVAMERKALASADAREYWQRKLGGEPAGPLFAPEGTAESDRARHVRTVQVTIARELSEALKKLSQENNAPLKTVLLAAHLRVLALITGQEQVITGLVAHGRPEGPDGERILGLFLNTLPFQVAVQGRSWRDLVHIVFETEKELLPHRHYPMAAIQNLLGRRLLFDATFMFLHFHVYGTLLPQQNEIFPLAVQNFQETNFPLVAEFSLDPFSLQLQLQLYLESSRFSENDTERFAGYYEAALRDLVQNYEAEYRNERLLSKTEWAKLLSDWQGGPVECGSVETLVRLFDEQVKKTPNAVAVASGNHQCSYFDLNAWSNRIAHHLKRRGVGPEVIVGICMDRSVAMVAALLGILKAGGAYLPLDSNHPPERLKYILHDAGVDTLLTEPGMKGLFDSCSARLLFLDEETLAAEPAHDPGMQIQPGNAAYVIYTSGSTGLPKGVAVPHGALINLLLAMKEKLDFRSSDRWLSVTTLAFDIAGLELYLPLLLGAQLWVATSEEVREGGRLRERIISTKATVLQATPVLWRLVLEAGDLPRSLRAGLCGGEAMSRTLSRALTSTTGLEVWNVYGPTETTIWSVVQKVEDGDTSIGRPLANTQVYVLDFDMQPVPVGVAGELYIGGTGLARGYLNRPELTAERFLPNPFSPSAGERVYRTGDLVRWSPEGKLEYLNRLDQQIKIRGYRIEMEEIEAVLLRQPGVQDAVVVPHEDANGDKRLAAYVVPHNASDLSGETLREALLKELPDYMVPALFAKLDALPLTPNGKVNRKALPKVTGNVRLEMTQTYSAPRNETEIALARIWEQVLDIPRAGIDDNFFASGGDSILSLRVLSKAHEQGIRFSLSDMFRHQTIRELCDWIGLQSAHREERKPTEPFSLMSDADRRKLPSGVTDGYPLTRLQAGMLYHSDLSANTYRNVHSFRLRGKLDQDAIRVAADGLTAAHPMLRTSFDLSSFSEPMQLVHAASELPVTICDLSACEPEDLNGQLLRIIAEEKWKKIDCKRPPLLRLRIDLLPRDEFFLVMTEHHALLDGWSVAALLMELFARYQAACERRSYSVPPVKENLGDFVAMERQAQASDEERLFWSKKVETYESASLPEPMGTRVDRKELQVKIPASLRLGLGEVARKAELPLKSLLLAVHLRVMGVVSGRQSGITGLVTHGRPETPGSDRILGLFLNTLPLHVKFKKESWRDLASRVFQAEQEIFAHRYYPLADLQRMAGGQVLFESSFNFTHFHIFKLLNEATHLQVLAGDSSAPTNIPLTANLRLDPDTHEVALTLVMEGGCLGSEQLDALGNRYLCALQRMAQEPDTEYLSNLLLSAEEREQVVRGWQGKEVAEEGEEYVGELLEAQAERSPEAIAVECGEQRWTYGELHERA
ncbi:MAG: amino acid adenylation domain-containing protein, partial [Actinomycetota bacterium]